VLEERMQGECPYIFMHNGMLAILFLFQDGEGSAFEHAVAHLEDARKNVLYYLDCSLYGGISAPVETLAGVPPAARQALTALEQCAIRRDEQLLCITDIEQGGIQPFPVDEFALRHMINSMKAGESEQAESALRKLMGVCRNAPPTPTAYQIYLLEILMGFLRVTPDLSTPPVELGSVVEQCSRSFFHVCPTVDEAEALFHRMLKLMMGAFQSNRLSSGLKLASEAEQYLKENYTQADITLEKLCSHLHISPSYFSGVFKKETKKTFHQYLTDLRMNRALTLLNTTALKTVQIAELVGLPDPSYFSYCFKKHFGYPPSTARKRKDK